MSLGERVKTLREKEKWLQEELADKTRLSQSYISNIERNACDPSMKTLARLAKALGLTVPELLTGVDIEMEN